MKRYSEKMSLIFDVFNWMRIMHIWVKNDMCLFARLWVWLLALASLKEEQIPYSPWNLCNIKKKKNLGKSRKGIFHEEWRENHFWIKGIAHEKKRMNEIVWLFKELQGVHYLWAKKYAEEFWELQLDVSGSLARTWDSHV